MSACSVYLYVLFFLTTGAHVSLTAQTRARASTAEEIYSKYINALGGHKNIAAIETFCSQWTNEIKQVQTNYRAKPNLGLYILVDSASNILTKVCLLGGVVCLAQKNLLGRDTSYQLREIRGVKSSESLNFINKLVSYKENGYKISLMDDISIDGQDCFVIKLIKEEKSYDLFYINQKSYWLVMHQTRYTNGSDGPQTYYSDYRQVNGVWFAFVEEISGSSFQAKKRVYTSIKVNVPIENSIFTCPTF